MHWPVVIGERGPRPVVEPWCLRRAGPDTREEATLLTGPALVVAAAFADTPFRELLWIAATLIDFAGPVMVDVEG